MNIRIEKRTILCVCLVLFSLETYAQLEGLNSQYVLNPITYNPGYGGTRDAYSAALSYRDQYSGLDESINTISGSVQVPLGLRFSTYRDATLGRPRGSTFSVNFLRDEIGRQRETSVGLDYAYLFPINRRTRLSLGVRLSARQVVFNTTDLTVVDGGDPLLLEDVKNDYLNVGFGVHMYERSRWYAAMSIPRIIGNKEDIITDDSGFLLKDRLNAYLSGGYLFDLNHHIKLRTSFFMRFVEKESLTTDLTSYLIYGPVWVGFSYRIDNAYVWLLAVDVNSQLRVGYSYEISTSDLSVFEKGSHEITLVWDLRPQSLNSRLKCYF